jgi:diguanylate cyclase (GGDEF)-like protein/PAS domain S-box-containing protein
VALGQPVPWDVVAEAFPDGVMVTDLHQVITYVNDGVERLTGYRRDQLVGKTPRVLQGEGTDPAAVQAMREQLVASGTFAGVVLNYRNDGHPFWNALRIAPLRGGDGRPAGYVALLRDVSQWLHDLHPAAGATGALVPLYRALAETRGLLGQTGERPASATLAAWCERLVEILGVQVAWIGHVPPDRLQVEVMAAAGPAVGYVRDLGIVVDAGQASGRGPVAMALRELRPVMMGVDDPRFAPWRARAERFGLQSVLAAAAPLSDASRVAVALYWTSEPPWLEELKDVVARLVHDAADWLERYLTSGRLARVQQYREAHRALQAQLLAAEEADDLFRAVADTLARLTDAQGISILVPDAGQTVLQRRAVAGPLAPYLERLPTPSLTEDAATGRSASGRAWQAGAPVLIQFPARDPLMPERWREPPLEGMGVIGAWPVHEPGSTHPIAVVVIVAADPDTFEPELLQLVEEIVQSTALAWAHWRHRDGLRRVQAYQRAALDAQQAFLQLPDAAAMYEELVRVLVEAVGCAAAYVAVPTAEGTALGLAAVAAASAEALAALRQVTPTVGEDTAWGWLLCAESYRTGRPVGPTNPWERPSLQAVAAELPALTAFRGAVAWPVGRRPDGHPAAVLVALRASMDEFSPDLTHLLAQLATSLEAALQKLDEQAAVAETARRDPLTGLGNRRALDDYLERALSLASGEGGQVALCLGDLDDFKDVNDRYGHLVGDQVLQAFADVLRKNLRDADFVGRWGGDEFVAVLSGLPDPGALDAILRRVAAVLEHPLELADRRRVRVRASVGIAVARGSQSRPQDLVRQADQALYFSKSHPSADAVRWTFFDQLADQDGVGFQLHDVRERLEVVYQPIWDAARHEATAVEALARWRTDAGTLAPPRDFLGRLSHAGRRQLTDLVLERAVHTLRGIHAGREIPLALNVNVWPELLVDSGWRRGLWARLKRHHWRPEWLTLEIVETAEGTFVAPQLPRILAALRQRGVRVALDDVGSGESSLVRLRRLPVDVVKLDMLLMRDVTRYPEGLLYVAALQGLARDLGLAVVVEGVETQEALRAVPYLGVSYVQGFAVARPLPASQLRRRMAVLAAAERKAVRPSLLECYALAVRDHRAWCDLPGEPNLTRLLPAQLAPGADRCPTSEYLARLGAVGSPIDLAHRALHQQAAQLLETGSAAPVEEAWTNLLEVMARAAQDASWLQPRAGSPWPEHAATLSLNPVMRRPARP